MMSPNNFLQLLDQGKIRVAEKINNNWQVNIEAKQNILDIFQQSSNTTIAPNSFDKIPLKFANWQAQDFINAKIRVMPGTTIRIGAYLAPHTIYMPCFINIGAFIDTGTLIDSGATIGSCAQIGKNCHISTNVALGGVLEPINNNPVIIEDNCFIGMGAMLAEGIIVGAGSVIGMGVQLGSSTKIINRITNKITYGSIPDNSVVVPGSYQDPKNNAISLNCAIIVKTVDAKTKTKTEINELLR